MHRIFLFTILHWRFDILYFSISQFHIYNSQTPFLLSVESCFMTVESSCDFYDVPLNYCSRLKVLLRGFLMQLFDIWCCHKEKRFSHLRALFIRLSFLCSDCRFSTVRMFNHHVNDSIKFKDRKFFLFLSLLWESFEGDSRIELTWNCNLIFPHEATEWVSRPKGLGFLVNKQC